MASITSASRRFAVAVLQTLAQSLSCTSTRQALGFQHAEVFRSRATAMTTTNTPRPQFIVDPIHGDVAEDPEVAQALEPIYQAIGWRPEPSPQLTGWRLTLTIDGQPVEQGEFDGAEEGFQNAQDAGSAWLAQHGADDTDQWLARSFQASRRMQWDRR
ncbi:MAG: hypothetical protein ACREO8_08690, partial [Luteimonas sp.]